MDKIIEKLKELDQSKDQKVINNIIYNKLLWLH